MPINPFYNLVSLSLFLVGFSAIFVWKIKFGTEWKIFRLGALAWFCAYIIKSFFSIFNETFYYLLPEVIFYIYVGLLTGIFEILIPLYIIIKKKDMFKKFLDKISFGIGFAGIEAIFLGFFVLLNYSITSFIILQQPDLLPENIVASFSYPTEVYVTTFFLAGWERLSALVFHVFSTLLLFAFLDYKKPIFLLSASLYKTFIDATAAYFTFTYYSFGEAIEIFYGAIALISLIIMWKFDFFQIKNKTKKSK